MDRMKLLTHAHAGGELHLSLAGSLCCSIDRTTVFTNAHSCGALHFNQSVACAVPQTE